MEKNAASGQNSDWLLQLWFPLIRAHQRGSARLAGFVTASLHIVCSCIACIARASINAASTVGNIAQLQLDARPGPHLVSKSVFFSFK